MPDTIPPQNAGAAQNPQDEAAIAAQNRMEMSAPIEQLAASDPIDGMPYTGESSAPATPASQITPAPVVDGGVPSSAGSLSSNVAPFGGSAQPSPEVEYVPIAPEDLLPPPLSPPPQPAPAPTPAPIPVAAPVPPSPAPTVEIPQPVQPQAPQPAPLPIYAPPPTQTPPRFEQQAAPLPQSSAPLEPINEVVGMAPESMAIPPALDAQTPANPSHGPAMAYSHNSHAVWKSQRSSKMVRLLAWGGVLAFFAVIFIYWLIIGSPTRVEDVPLIRSLIK